MREGPLSWPNTNKFIYSINGRRVIFVCFIISSLSSSFSSLRLFLHQYKSTKFTLYIISACHRVEKKKLLYDCTVRFRARHSANEISWITRFFVTKTRPVFHLGDKIGTRWKSLSVSTQHRHGRNRTCVRFRSLCSRDSMIFSRYYIYFVLFIAKRQKLWILEFPRHSVKWKLSGQCDILMFFVYIYILFFFIYIFIYSKALHSRHFYWLYLYRP